MAILVSMLYLLTAVAAAGHDSGDLDSLGGCTI